LFGAVPVRFVIRQELSFKWGLFLFVQFREPALQVEKL
jgi:hypothetical protein